MTYNPNPMAPPPLAEDATKARTSGRRNSTGLIISRLLAADAFDGGPGLGITVGGFAAHLGTRNNMGHDQLIAQLRQITDLTVLIDTLFNMKVSQEAVFEATRDVDGADAAITAALGNRDSATQASRLGVAQENVELVMDVMVDGQLTPIQLGPGWISPEGLSGEGLVVLSASAADLLARTGASFTEGQIVDSIYWVDAEGARSTPSPVRVYFGDSDGAAVADGAAQSGVVPPAASDDPTAFFEDLVSNVTLGATDFIGLSTGRSATRTVPTWIDPSGVLEVPPVWRDGDQNSFVEGMQHREIQSLQQELIDAGLAPGGYASGLWDSDWAGIAATVMQESNVTGAVLDDRWVANGAINPAVIATTGYGGDGGDNRMAGFRDSIRTLGQWVTTNKRTLPAYESQAIRERIDPRDLEAGLQGYAMSHIGRRLDRYQLAHLGRFLEAQAREIEAQDEMIAARTEYINAGATDPSQPFDLTVEQERIVGTDEVVLKDDQWAKNRLEEKFKEMFANDYAQMAARSRFNGAQVRQGRMEQTIMSTIGRTGGG